MRWTPKRKAEIIEAILNGRLIPVDAIKQYGLSEEELAAWLRDYLDHGREGLRVTKLQRYRQRGSHLISEAIGSAPQPGKLAGSAVIIGSRKGIRRPK